MAMDGEVMQMQHFLSPRRRDLFRLSYFHVSYRRRVPATLNWPRQSLGGSCQSSEMATRLNLLYFVFKNSLLPKYRSIIL